MKEQLTILIIDDDPYTIQMIEDSIPWSKYGITEVLHAFQGVMGMEIVRQKKPEIIISDIEMPQMDGMEFLEKVADFYEEMPEFIILTSHEDFQYYRKSIHFGVKEYLLKPFRQEELAAVLSKSVARLVRNNIQNTTEKQNNRKDENDYFQKDQGLLIQSLLNGLFNFNITGNREYIGRLIQAKGIQFDVGSPYYILYAGTSIDAIKRKDIQEAEFYFIFGNVASEVLSDRVNYPAVVSHTLRSNYILIVVIPESVCTRADLIKKCDRLGETAKHYLGVNLICLVGEHSHIEDFGKISQKMDEVFLREGAFQTRTLFLEEDTDNRESSNTIIDQVKIAELLKGRKKTELIIQVREYMKRLEEDSAMNLSRMQLLQNDLIQVFYSYLYENHIQAYQVFQDDMARRVMESASDSVIGMIRFVNYMYDATIANIDQLQKSETVVEKVKLYIQERFKDKISREDIASSVFLTPNYLSTIFKENTGITLREYINQCRVTEAQRLMVSTGRNLSDIAMEVGFDNIPYFSTVFKKVTGVAPAVWRRETDGIETEEASSECDS